MNTSPMVADHTARVLIVDDERQNRRLLEVMLAPEGFDLRTAESGEQALAMTADEPPDLILLDILMPGIDGFRVVGKLKGNPATRNIPIIMVTALGDQDARMFGLSAGAEEFLTRPVDRAELVMRVRNLLRLKAYGEHYDKCSEMIENQVASRTADLVARTRTLEQEATASRTREELTNQALAAARLGAWEIDMTTQALVWSATMPPLFGLTPDQAPTSLEAFLALVHPDDRQMVGESVAQAPREGTELAVEFRALWPDGSTHWLAARGRVLRDTNDKPARLLGIGADIGDRKSLEARLVK